MSDHACTMPGHGGADAPHACCRPRPVAAAPAAAGWGDRGIWRRAARNTAHCLLGCTLGDLAVMGLLPLAWPQVPSLVLQVLAILGGLASSLALEAAVLRWREGFAWRQAVATALGMSLVSMVMMEAVMNAVDWLAMGGARQPMHHLSFWLAWGPALAAGFLAPLPYNYRVLRRHGRACH